MSGLEMSNARTRLRLGILSFVLALAIPSLLLVDKAYDQIKWESFRQQQIAAEEFAARIDRALAQLVRNEESRGIDDYGFVIGIASAYPRRSPLSELTATQAIPGLVGWFQVRADGRFSSPLVPEPGVSPSDFGLDSGQIALRQAQSQRIEDILVGNRLVERGARELDTPTARTDIQTAELERHANEQSAYRYDRTQDNSLDAHPSLRPASNRLSQAAFERLAEDATSDVSSLTKRRAKRSPELSEQAETAQAKSSPSEPSDTLGLEEPPAAASTPSAPVAELSNRHPVQLFDTAIEPMEVGRLDSGHFLLFRSVWRDGERIIQGALIEQGAFLEAIAGETFETTALARNCDLTLTYRGESLASFRSPPERTLVSGTPALSGSPLYRTRMQEPFGGLELIFSVTRLPNPPGAAVIGWMAAALASVLLAGGWLMYRLGMGQIELVRQQQDFVSSVSHELKTPLTSIRMYAEMLSAGFAAEHRKQTYYRLIHEESERLSRLIANVLQLARIGRDALVLEIQPIAVETLMQTVRERVAAQVERAGFVLEIVCDTPGWVQVDPDAFVQIFINLVDNALKFAADTPERCIRIACESRGEQRICLSVRDFGPGIPRSQRNRVFRLFYRGEEAKQRAISGTGIGLALVRRLTLAMDGRVELIGREPGAEFRIELPRTQPP